MKNFKSSLNDDYATDGRMSKKFNYNLAIDRRRVICRSLFELVEYWLSNCLLFLQLSEDCFGVVL